MSSREQYKEYVKQLKTQNINLVLEKSELKLKIEELRDRNKNLWDSLKLSRKREKKWYHFF